MSFTPERAAIRFGCGLSPRKPALGSVDDMLAMLSGPDFAAQDFPIPGMEPVFEMALREQKARRATRPFKGTDAYEAAFEKVKIERRAMRDAAAIWFGQSLMRRAQTADGFRERLSSFWTDHFTATGKQLGLKFAQINYAQEAIRPHVAGRFADMLRAAATHPLMLHYLDQAKSVGPDSRIAKRNPKRGLNENLAREMLELHTLGVGGPYTQTDVRQLAELLAGLTFTHVDGFLFAKRQADPGVKTILGRRYGGEDRLSAIHQVFEDISIHPATARHLAAKLAVHFVGDSPDMALVEAMETRFLDTDGDLLAVYEVLLNHPSAWGDGMGNVKQPIDFIGSSLRALDLQPRQMPTKKVARMRKFFYSPLVMMGQTWGHPAGPDGWPEADEDWITPQRLAARLQWAMSTPLRLRRTLPDPRDFVEIALGGAATEQVRFAARAAESRPEGVGIVLSSVAFQRM
ncbi:MAG: DUF1800 domain-containing protein [Pseudomonadota bacterium]